MDYIRVRLLQGENGMVYVMSDVHGLFDKYSAMLARIAFTETDTLYVLGDVLDRGPDGFRIMLDMARRPNVVGLLGNHEMMAASLLPVLLRVMRRDDDGELSAAERKRFNIWLRNGGQPSILQFLQLGDDEIGIIFRYIGQLPICREAVVGDGRFVLVHAGLEGFSVGRPLTDYGPEDCLFCRPAPETVYFQDRMVVLGHTPTRLFYQLAGVGRKIDRIFYRPTWIGIDCGCACSGGRLGCLCLDTMEEFYV